MGTHPEVGKTGATKESDERHDMKIGTDDNIDR